MSGFAGGMVILLDPYMLWVILSGTVLGVIVGALPGLSGSTTTALLLPLTGHGAGPERRLPRIDLLRREFRRLDHERWASLVGGHPSSSRALPRP